MTRNRYGFARSSLAIAIACALVPAGLAAASSGSAGSSGHMAIHKKPVCNLLRATPQNTIAFGDVSSSQPSQLDPALQVVSADVATKGQLLTWVIRVKKLSPSYGTGTPTGRSYEFDFVANGVTVHLGADESPFGTRGDGNMPHSKATFDTQHNQIRETVPFGDIANHFGVSIRNRQSTMSDLEAIASKGIYVPGVGNPRYGSNEQVGPVASTYLAGAPSCVKVGS